MGKIRIDEAGHFYLNEYDIGPFVASYKREGEQLVVKLIGDIELPKKSKPKPKKKVVKHDG